jgi:hypothetical protein
MDTNNKYILRRLKEASTDSFNLKPDPKTINEKANYSLSGDGSTPLGITGDQSFTLSFKNNDQASASLLTFCTAHQSMQSVWSINQAPEPEN